MLVKRYYIVWYTLLIVGKTSFSFKHHFQTKPRQSNKISSFAKNRPGKTEIIRAAEVLQIPQCQKCWWRCTLLPSLDEEARCISWIIVVRGVFVYLWIIMTIYHGFTLRPWGYFTGLDYSATTLWVGYSFRHYSHGDIALNSPMNGSHNWKLNRYSLI